MLFPLLQESPSKRRKKAKKAKPLQLIIPNEVTATETGCDKQLKLTDRVKPIVDYVRKTLYELISEIKDVFLRFKGPPLSECKKIAFP